MVPGLAKWSPTVRRAGRMTLSSSHPTASRFAALSTMPSANALVAALAYGGRAMNDFIAYLQELFADFGAVSARAMFGGYGLYHDGVMIGLVIDDGLYLKVDSHTRHVFEAAASQPFVYTQTAKPVTMSYWSVPAAALDSSQAMLPWARLAYEAALRKPKAPKRPARKVPRPPPGKPRAKKASPLAR